MLESILKKHEFIVPDRLRQIIDAMRRHDLLKGLTPENIRKILEDLGPVFVKIGQLMSMRPDFLPQEYCDELTKLQMEAAPIPFEKVMEIIESEYRRPWNKIFRSIDPEALGSASIAQVHRAELDDGRRVVIKVQRPGIYDVMERDILMMKRAASLLKVVRTDSGIIDFDMLLDEMWSIAKQEMDFLIEAEHIEEFGRLNADEEYVECPRVIKSITTPRILVMDYIEGIRFDDLDSLREKGFDQDVLGRRLGENYVKQIVEDGYFHADPHPGNIRIKGGKIVWLDLGMMGRLRPRDRTAIFKAMLALSRGDTLAMKSAVLELGKTNGRIDHTKLYEDIDALMKEYSSLDFSRLEMGNLTRQIIAVLRTHRIGIGPGLSMFARGVLTIEGVLRKAAPNIRFVEIFARSIDVSFSKKVDWRTELEKIQREGYFFFKKTMKLPEQISDILNMTMSGQTKVNLDLTGAEEPLRRIDQMMNRLVLAMISAALLLASSVICTTGMTPTIMGIPLLGMIGYIAALVLCGRLLWNIIR